MAFHRILFLRRSTVAMHRGTLASGTLNETDVEVSPEATGTVSRRSRAVDGRLAVIESAANPHSRQAPTVTPQSVYGPSPAVIERPSVGNDRSSDARRPAT